MLVLTNWRYLVVARVFMISLARVLERLKNCTIFVKKLWHVHVLNYDKLIYEVFIYPISNTLSCRFIGFNLLLWIVSSDQVVIVTCFVP